MGALLAGAAVYYLQVYAYYEPVPVSAPAAEVRLTSLVTGEAEMVPVDGFEGIDSESSPLRFRACFEMPLSLALLTETYVIRDEAVPLNAPGWFDCFDAAEIGAALETGGAVAFLGEANVSYGIDRVVAVFEDGRAVAWNQINACGQVVFDGRPPPPGCPPPPAND
ncbi:histidine kinase [Rhodovulum iodosum]|nr:histidine kinase [Rhodovulum robiginosum]